MKNFTFILILATFFGSCDIVDVPLEKPIPIPIDTTTNPIDTNTIDQFVVDTSAINTTTRKVFVEEYTGHKCNGCPAQTDKLIKHQDTTEHQIIIMSYHTGTLAHTDDDYPTDFTTEFGDKLYDALGSSNPQPFAVVKRRTWTKFANKYVFVGQPEWDEPIEDRLNDPNPTIAMGLIAQYSQASNSIQVRVSLKTIQEITDELRLTVLIMEDSIIDDQKDSRLNEDNFPGFRNPNYMHRHVMRAQLNAQDGFYGKSIISASGKAADEWIDWKQGFTLPSTILEVKHCSIIAFVTHAISGEIEQVEECHVQVVE